MLITPPANSAGRSGVADFVIIKLSIMFAGNKSNEKAFRSLSELGSAAPLINAKLYRSLNPLTTTNLLS